LLKQKIAHVALYVMTLPHIAVGDTGNPEAGAHGKEHSFALSTQLSTKRNAQLLLKEKQSWRRLNERPFNIGLPR
jgi:hypothetical protein